MGLSISNFTGGSIITATDVLNRVDEVEKFVNGGIVAADLKSSSPWVDAKHIVKPEFYGSPAPRTHGTTFDAHYRRTSGALQESTLFYEDISTDDWLVIPGLAASFHIPAEAYCQIYATFYLFGSQGGTYPNSAFMEDFRSAYFALHVNGTVKNSTYRSMWAGTDGFQNLAKRQHSIAYAVDGTLARGNHSVSVRIKMQKNSTASALTLRNWEKVYVTARNLVVHLNYK